MDSPSPIRVLVHLPKSLGLRLSLLAPLAAIRDQHPEASIVAIAELGRFARDEPHPEFDTWVEVPGNWSGRLAACWRLRQQRADFVLHESPSGHRNGLSSWLRAKHRVQVGRPVRPNETPQSAHPPAFRLSLRRLETYGIRSPAVISHGASPGAPLRVRSLRQSAHLMCPYLVLYAGNGDNPDTWRAESFGKVARSLGEQLQRPSLIVWSGRESRARAESAAANSGGHALVAPPTSLTDLAELIRTADLVLSCDIDMLDIATAQGASTVNPLKKELTRATADDAAVERVAGCCERFLSAQDSQRQSRAA